MSCPSCKAHEGPAGEKVPADASGGDQADLAVRVPEGAPGSLDAITEVPEPYGNDELHPPSFAESQFDVIRRRQVGRQHGFKFAKGLPSRFLNLSNAFEFAGWGTVSYLELKSEDYHHGLQDMQQEHEDITLGPWEASGVAANDVLGGVFYSLPPVYAVSGVFSPICLIVATCTMFLWRPIFVELASAITLTGANYTYLLNVSSKSLAMAAAALALLDYATTAVISAATTSAYVAGEASMPFPVFVGTILLFIPPLVVTLCGMKESVRAAFGILLLHGLTMSMLMMASVVAWIRHGNGQLVENWHAGQPGSASAIARQVFNGICLGSLGLTGFECSPDYAVLVKKGDFRKLLRNIHLPAIALNGPLMLLLLVHIPTQTLGHSSNALSLLAQAVGGRWLRIFIVVDATVVLSAGVLTGILGACALFQRLAHDRVLPTVFLQRLPLTQARGVGIGVFTLLAGVIYASAGANLNIISKMFAVTWLSVMFLFPVSLLLLKFSRGRLARTNTASLPMILLTMLISLTVFAGNIAMHPTTIGIFAIYGVVILAGFATVQNKVSLVHRLYWACDQIPLLHESRRLRRASESLIKTLKRWKRQPVCILTKTDELHDLFRMVSYVKKNEETSYVKLVHMYDAIEDIPTELEANAKLIDEAFPDITIDMIFVQAPFTPPTIAALAHRLRIPRSLMFMSCPGPNFDGHFAEFGARIIAR